MEKELNDYLEKIEKYLKPMTASERIDIVKEIKSEILELQGNGMSSEDIVERLGDPRELSKSYLADVISQKGGFSWRKLGAFLAFYSLAGLYGMFILPFTSISAVTFLIVGAITPIAGIIKLAAHLGGIELSQICFNIGSYTAGAVEFLPISIVIGAAFFALGMLMWKLTVMIIKSMSKGMKKLGNDL